MKIQTSQTRKGIWIALNNENPLVYETFLSKPKEPVVSFIPFEHTYSKQGLGSIGFLDLSDIRLHISSVNIRQGLFQNHFYPLGSFPDERVPELVGKGLATKIEFEVAKNLASKFHGITPIIIGASSDSHLKYCERVGLVPNYIMTLDEYIAILNKK